MIYVLTGPNAGQTGVWGGVSFVEGRAEIPDDAAGLASILSRYYGAVPEGDAVVEAADEAPASLPPAPKRKRR